MKMHQLPRPGYGPGRMLVCLLVLAVLAAALPSAALGQPTPTPPNSAEPRFNPAVLLANSGNAIDVVVGDLNGDGATDVVLANREGPSQVYLNRGGRSGAFAPPAPILGSGGEVAAAALGDLDGDGDLDLVVARFREKSQVFLNDGRGSFSLAGELPAADTYNLALGDLDGDGAYDLVLANLAQPSQIYRNTGGGALALVATLADSGRQAWSVAIADLDGDGALDIVLGNNSNTPSQIYYNDSAARGVFGAPVPLSGTSLVADVAAGDVDADGRPDLVLGRRGGDLLFGAVYDEVYVNTGGRQFAFGEELRDNETTWSVALGDLNSDTFPDVVTANRTSSGSVFTNGRARTLSPNNELFPFASPLPGAEDLGTAVAVADLNGDGALDVVQSVSLAGSRIYFNRGAVGFNRTALLTADSGDSTQEIAVGDLNRDGLDDAVLLNVDDRSQVYLATGDGEFGLPASLPGGLSSSVAGALADLNGDGNLDLAAAVAARGVAIYAGTPEGALQTPTTLAGTGPDFTMRDVLAGDLNGDSRPDLVLLSATGQPGQPRPNLVFLANGSGGFAAPAAIAESAALIQQGALGDLDGDGDLDLLVVARPAGNMVVGSRVYYNDGSGAFAARRDLLPAGFDYQAASGAVGDLNGDGLQDVVLGGGDAPTLVFLSVPAQGPVLAGVLDVALTRSVALGDFDGDGDSDLIQGNEPSQTYDGPSRFYRNRGDGTFEPPLAIPGAAGSGLRSIVPGRFDAGLTLDFIQGSSLNASRVFLNGGAGDFTQRGPLRYRGAFTTDVALGDVDGNQTLDWARAAHFGPSLVEGVGPIATPLLPGDGRFASGMAAGDLNGDGVLDLVLARSCEPLGSAPQTCVPRPSLVYLNSGGGTFGAGLPLPGSTGDPARAKPGDLSRVAVGDLNGDGPVDIVLARMGEPALVYLNDGRAGFAAPRQLPLAPDGPGNASDVALGDFDRNGALDVLIARFEGASLVYRNDGQAGFTAPAALAGSGRRTVAAAVGDVSGDGAPDIVLANSCFSQPGVVLTCSFDPAPSQLYRNDGDGGFLPPVDLPEPGAGARDVAIGDMDNDRDLDLVVATQAREGANDPPSRVVLNDGAGNFTRTVLIPFGASGTIGAIALGDLDFDGLLDIFRGGYGFPGGFFGSGRLFGAPLGDSLPGVYILGPTVARAGGEAIATRVAAPYATPEVFTSRVITFTYQIADLQSDPVQTVRASFSTDGGGTWREAVPATGTLTADLATSPGGTAHTFAWDTFASGLFGRSDNVLLRIEALPGVRPRPNRVPGPFQQSVTAAVSPPFRVQGTGVQVRTAAGAPVAGAAVYRVPRGQAEARSFPDPARPPRVTTATGVVPGNGELQAGDALVALVPISSTATYTIYATSAVSDGIGLELRPLTSPGLQTLTLNPERRLVRFNLDVALEWDARGDPSYLDSLQRDLRRAAEILYDWSDGQVTLGSVRIFQNREQWDDAHIRIYASNRLRPNAAKGGVTEPGSERFDPARPDDERTAYLAGQVRIGPQWNRYGDPGVFGEDWPRALAHELGHYLLYLDDNYLGLDTAGRLINVDSCRGAMSDPYRDDSEFHPEAGWLRDCGSTLSQRLVGRSDWGTILTFYPGLRAPPTYGAGSGPVSLPLPPVFTFVPPAAPGTALAAPLFPLVNAEDGGRYLAGPGAQGFLFRQDRLIALGGPAQDQILARGAAPGDRLCLFDLGRQRAGCTTLGPEVQPLAMTEQPGWQPELLVTPVTTATLRLSLVQPGLTAATLRATVYPATRTAPLNVTLVREGDGRYGATVNSSPQAPVFEGMIHVVADVGGTARETVADFLVGGNPGRKYARNAPRSNPGRKYARNAPVLSADGQAVLFGSGLAAEEGQLFALQSVERPPAPEAWTVPLGRGYRLTAGDPAALAGGSILIGYLGSDLRPRYGAGENAVRVYFWDESRARWEALPTTLDPDRNEASAPVRGEGIYALLIASPFAGTGWQLFQYTGPELPPEAALPSVGPSYRLVYERVPADAADPWKLYAPGAPEWVSDLASLTPGRQYYAYVPEPAGQGVALASLSLNPPATYYGVVPGGDGFTPVESQEVLALVGETVCGRGRTRAVGEQIVYSVNVNAVGTGDQAGCGTTGRTVRFQVAGRLMATTAPWDDTNLTRLDLETRVAARVSLPLVRR
jgi:hypothetical protein